MPRRLEIELTSKRDDGSWTWRAAGARQPKGTVDGAVVPAGLSTGDVVKADADFDIDGITILSIVPPGGGESGQDQVERLEIIGSGREEPTVTTNLARKERSDRRPKRRGDGRRPDGGERGERRDRGQGADRGQRGDQGARGQRGGRPGGPGGSGGSGAERGGRADQGARGERRGSGERAGGRPGGARDSRPRRPAPPPLPERPKPKRLRPGNARRRAVIDALPPEHQPIAEQALAGGIPAVRKAIQDQNTAARADQRPEVDPEPLLAIAQDLLPRLRAAEWLDRAEAAVKDLDELDLRDLRSVVTAADDVVRDDAARELAASLKEGLGRRVERAHEEWVEDVTTALDHDRVVRALRVSARPPDPKRRLPDESLAKLAEAAGESMSNEVTAERWMLVLEAVSYSPVRKMVTPKAPPSEPSAKLLEALAKGAQRTPQIARLFGIDPAAPPPQRHPKPRARRPVPPPPTDQAPPSPAPDATEGPPAAEATPEAAADPTPSPAPEPTEEAGPAPASSTEPDQPAPAPGGDEGPVAPDADAPGAPEADPPPGGTETAEQPSGQRQ